MKAWRDSGSCLTLEDAGLHAGDLPEGTTVSIALLKMAEELLGACTTTRPTAAPAQDQRGHSPPRPTPQALWAASRRVGDDTVAK